jgi:hypothetical protein
MNPFGNADRVAELLWAFSSGVAAAAPSVWPKPRREKRDREDEDFTLPIYSKAAAVVPGLRTSVLTAVSL